MSENGHSLTVALSEETQLHSLKSHNSAQKWAKDLLFFFKCSEFYALQAQDLIDSSCGPVPGEKTARGKKKSEKKRPPQGGLSMGAETLAMGAKPPLVPM